jgi:hypothetical protein
MSAQAEQMQRFIGDLVKLVEGSRVKKRASWAGRKNIQAASVAEPIPVLSPGGRKRTGKAAGKDLSHYWKPSSSVEQIFPLGDTDISQRGVAARVRFGTNRVNGNDKSF